MTMRKDPDSSKRNPGRRISDYQHTWRIEVHPAWLSLATTIIAVVLAIIGYLGKNWIDNMTYEVRQLRLVMERQASENAVNIQWKSDIVHWRDGVDNHLSNVDWRLDGRKTSWKDMNKPPEEVRP